MKYTVVLFTLLLFCAGSVFSQQAISSDSLQKHVYLLASDNLEGRSIGTKGADMAAQYIVQQFKSIGIKPFTPDYYHHFVYKSGAISSEGKNIIGIIEGSDPILKNEYIVLGAHYDHIGYYFKNGDKIIYNGADDNASGVASVIELSRAILENKTQFKRSIILVAFDGEESGLNGSTWFINDKLLPTKQIKLMMSIDMVGMLSKNEGLELDGVQTLKNGGIIAQQIATKLNFPIKTKTKALSLRTDTKPFGEAGIAAIHISTGTLSPYHKPEDDADLLDYKGMAFISQFIYCFTLKTANLDSNLLVSKIQRKKRDGEFNFYIKPGVRLNLGSAYHNYPDQYYRGKNGFAVQAGLYAHINIINFIVLQPEIVYETIGSESSNGNFRSHSISTPVNLLLRIAGNDTYDTWSYLELGGYYTHHFSGKDGSVDIDYTNTFNPEEYGLNVGFLINISKVQIGITRKIGLTNLYQDKTVGNIHNSALMGKIGVRF